MKPIHYSEVNVVLAKDQPEYLQLPAHTAGGDEGIITSCWKLTFTERLKILWSGKFWLQQMTFGHLLQPQKPSADKPTLKG